MSDDERVVRSFVAADEDLLGSWTVTQAKRSKGQLPPSSAGEETVAVTEDRLLWFTSELEEVALEDVEDVEREYIERQAAPPMVLGGGLLFVVGVFASIGAYFATGSGPLVVAFPALTGLGVFLATRVIASVTGREGEVRAGHRLRLWTEDGVVSIWGDDEEAIAALETALGAGTTSGGDPVEDGTDPADGADDSFEGAGDSVDGAGDPTQAETPSEGT